MNQYLAWGLISFLLGIVTTIFVNYILMSLEFVYLYVIPRIS